MSIRPERTSIIAEYSRRDFLGATAGTLLAGTFDFDAVCANSSTIDEALDIFHRTGPEYGGGLSNHGPMAAEVLFRLGRPEAAMDWVEKYKHRLQSRPKAGNPVSRTEWRNALGGVRRLGDWIVFFDRELAEAPWQDVLRQWVPRLLPALMAAATHGTIRTSHAVRSLSAAETPQRLHELAEGLGYWAARYQVLPGSPTGEDAGLLPGEAIARVQRIYRPDMKRGFLYEGVKALDQAPAFEDDIDLVDTDGDLSQFISRLTETFAELYLSNGFSIAFAHSVTAPSALRILIPFLAAADARLAVRYGWQACAALYARYADTALRTKPKRRLEILDADELIDRAIAAEGAHTIKLTEVCLREYRVNPKPVYLMAALDAAERRL